MPILNDDSNGPPSVHSNITTSHGVHVDVPSWIKLESDIKAIGIVVDLYIDAFSEAGGGKVPPGIKLASQ